jgi:AsmA-like C-terminal region
VQLPALDVDVALQDAGLQSVDVKAQDGTLQLNMVPDGKTYKLHMEVDDWKLPTERGDVIHHAVLDGGLGDNVLMLNAFTLDMFDGEITGNGSLTWLKQWKLTGDLKLSKLDMQTMSKQADSKTYLSGRLFGNGGFDATANAAGDLADHLAVKLDFNVKDGVLYGIDLMHAAELLVKTDSKSGQTQFDVFDGQFKWLAGAVQFNRVQMVSGLIKATGDVGISKDKMLKGDVSVALKDSAGVVAVPLEISGPVSNPVVLPNKAAAIGAAVGTVLAPGVGTSLGIKAGEQVGKLKNLFSD